MSDEKKSKVRHFRTLLFFSSFTNFIFHKMKDKRRSNIYNRIILAFTVILLLVGMICTRVYWQGVSLIKDEITQVIIEQNESMVRNMQNEFRQIRLMKYQLVNSGDIIDLLLAVLNEDKAGKQVDIGQIQDGLTTIWQGNTLIREATVIIPAAELVINTGTSFALNEDWEKLVEDCGAYPPGILQEYEGRILLFSSYMGSEYYVCVELETDGLQNLLIRLSGEKAGVNILCHKETGVFVGRVIEPAAEQVIRENIAGVRPGEIMEKDGYLFCVTDDGSGEYACVTFAENTNIYGKLSSYRNIYLVMLIIIFGAGIWFWRMMFGMVHRPMQVLVSSLNQVTGGNLDSRISYQRNDEFQYIYDSFNNMTNRLKELIDKNLRQEILLQKAQLKQLQTQISPHFFYNSFIILSNRISAEDYEFAAEFSRQLGQYFMFVTRSGREYITLGEEMEHACTYVNIQSTRFRNHVTAEIEPLSEAHREIRVPRLILQPVLENIFKYVVEKSRDNVLIKLSFGEGSEELGLIIENSGDLKEEELSRMRKQLDEQQGDIHGLANIHQRLLLVYPESGGLILDKSDWGGLRVTFRLPYVFTSESPCQIPGEVT